MAEFGSYDYIVVGAGTAGSVLASRLSEHPEVRVLLLEAGPASGPAMMADPSAWPLLMGSKVDWAYTTTAQAHLCDAILPWPRGKVLGGSSGINAMAHIRGPRADFDAWQASGATGWGYDEILPYFKRTEHTEGRQARDTVYRGTGGPLRVGPLPEVTPISTAFYNAVVAAGYPSTEDVNGKHQEGAFWYDVNIVNARRQSAADAYITPVMNRPNLVVVTEALVHHLPVKNGRCLGADYLVAGRPHHARAGQEVVLTAGTIGSAQLLMLSGIGLADSLRDLGIRPVQDLPGVGENLQDHPQCGIVYATAESVTGTNNHGEAGALLRSRPELAGPDIQLLIVDAPRSSHRSGLPEFGYTISVALVAPASRGSVRLQSSDPQAAPFLDPNYYGKSSDLDVMTAGFWMAREVGENPAFSAWKRAEVLPGPDVQDEASLRDYIRRHTRTYFHPVGTCRMGTDKEAVVDPNLRVYGLEGLRVADASVMPTIVRTNTNATTLAIAERAADLVIADRNRR